MASFRTSTLLMAAMRPDSWRTVVLPIGTVVATDSPCEIVDGLRDVCGVLEWVVSIHDADRTNLADVMEARSPLRHSIDHAGRSDKDWLFVLRGANRALLDDPRHAALLASWASRARLVVVTDELGEGQEKWSRVRIDAS